LRGIGGGGGRGVKWKGQTMRERGIERKKEGVRDDEKMKGVDRRFLD
jgi:hypothetical protein